MTTARSWLRWIHVHLIVEYARHVGHADVLAEQLWAPAGTVSVLDKENPQSE